MLRVNTSSVSHAHAAQGRRDYFTFLGATAGRNEIGPELEMVERRGQDLWRVILPRGKHQLFSRTSRPRGRRVGGSIQHRFFCSFVVV